MQPETLSISGNKKVNSNEENQQQDISQPFPQRGLDSFGKKLPNTTEGHEIEKEPRTDFPMTFGEIPLNFNANQDNGNIHIDQMLLEHKKKKILQKFPYFRTGDTPENSQKTSQKTSPQFSCDPLYQGQECADLSYGGKSAEHSKGFTILDF